MKSVQERLLIGLICVVLLLTLFILQPYIQPASAQPTADNTQLAASTSALVLSEVMAANRSSCPDPAGVFSDWIEVWNSGADPIDISGFTLTNNSSNPAKWMFPSMVMKPNTRLLLWATGLTSAELNAQHYPPQSQTLCVSFRVSASGENLYLYNSQGSLLDEVTAPRLEDNQSYARIGDVWQISNQPTPGESNDDAGFAICQAARWAVEKPIRISEFMYGNNGLIADAAGRFPDWIELVNMSDAPISLLGYGLSDNDKPFQYLLPDVTLAPGERLLVWASIPEGYGDEPVQGYYTNFGINGTETLSLTNPAGLYVERIPLLGTQGGNAYAPNDAGDGWQLLEQPSPGEINSAEGYELMIEREMAYMPQGLMISDVMAHNRGLYRDESDASPDYARIYNNGTESVALAGWGLSDNTGDPFRWLLPDTTLTPGASLLVAAQLDTGPHLSDGEPVLLTAPDGRCVDRLPPMTYPVNVAVGRLPGQEGLFFFDDLADGAQRQGQRRGFLNFTPQQPEGMYPSALTVALNTPSDATIYYTLDGSLPGVDKTIYSQPIIVDKTTILRVTAIADNAIKQPVYTYTYFVGVSHNLPVLSLSTAPENLWDEQTGIYVKGSNADDEFPYKNANFWKPWEKPAHFQMFETDGSCSISMDVGLKIFGQYSRAMEQKAFSIIARNEYGSNEILHPNLFEDKPQLTEFKSLVLRSSGQDGNLTKIRDALISRLGRDYDLDYQAYRPTVLYLNGEYWGIYNIREKISEHFIAANNDIEDPKDMDILEANGVARQGNADDFIALRTYADTHDLSQDEHYQYVAARMDVENFLVYNIVQSFSGNTDLANVRMWRQPESAGGAGGDGKWRWILYDSDWGFLKPDDGGIERVMRKQNGAGGAHKNWIFPALMKNTACRARFIELYAEMLAGPLSSETVLSDIQRMTAAIEDEIPREKARWNYWVNTPWSKQLDRVTTFAAQRPAEIVKQLDAAFSLTTEQKNMLLNAIGS